MLLSVKKILKISYRIYLNYQWRSILNILSKKKRAISTSKQEDEYPAPFRLKSHHRG